MHDTTTHILKALANPIRLKLLRLLNEKTELSVQQISDLSPRETSTVSKHLNHFSLLGLVTVRQEAQSRFYSLNRKTLVNFLEGILEEFKVK